MKKTLRTGVIGVGKMGAHHARIYATHEDASLVGVYDADRTAAAEVANRYGCRAFPTLDALLKSNIDAVSIAVPTSLHAEVAIQALEAGLHVLIEKPIAATPADAEAMLRVARRKERTLMVGHIERFNPAIIALREIIDPASILSISIVRVGPRPPRIKDTGVIIDLAVHDIDLVHYLTGQSVEEVHCVTSSHFTRHEDTASLLLRMRGGIGAQITSNWITPYKAREVQVVTAKALVQANLLTQQVRRFSRFSSDDGSYVVEEIRTGRHEPLQAELDAFLTAVREGHPPPVTGEAGLDALAVAIAAVKQRPARPSDTLRLDRTPIPHAAERTDPTPSQAPAPAHAHLRVL